MSVFGGFFRRRRVLVTGASGFIGRQVCPTLRSRGVMLRAFDRRPNVIADEVVEGTLEDLPKLRVASKGVDTILHLAAMSDDADFVTRLVPSNVIGVYNVLEAARLERVRRVILASSCAVANLVRSGHKVATTDRFPTSHYGLTKLWAEDMGEMYSRRYGLSVLAVRFGWVVRTPEALRGMSRSPNAFRIFLSHRDLREFVLCCLQAKQVPFAVVYALSRQSGGDIFDMEPARRLVGFEPRDSFPEGLDFELSHVGAAR